MHISNLIISGVQKRAESECRLSPIHSTFRFIPGDPCALINFTMSKPPKINVVQKEAWSLFWITLFPHLSCRVDLDLSEIS